MDSVTLSEGLPYDIELHSFGCKLNFSDTDNLNQQWKKLKQKQSVGPVKVHVLNTCAVTAEATRSATRMARKLKSQNPFCRVVMTGCAAQVDTDILQATPGVDLIVANSHKGNLFEILDDHFKSGGKQTVFKSNIFLKKQIDSGLEPTELRTRAFLKIQDGCNSFCSFCIIPFARGRSRSLSINTLISHINSLHAQGIQEVVLTGIHIADYDDKGQSLEVLVEEVLKHTRIPRIRLSSLEPPEITDRLLDAYQDDRMCAHFHVSLQTIQTDVLSDMRRKYSAEVAQKVLEKIHAKLPQAFVGMDLIVGFPTETPERFNETKLRLLDSPWSKIHVFPYSERTGTKAMQLAAIVPMAERKNRSKIIRELSHARHLLTAKRQVGQLQNVLLMNKPAKGANGLSRNFWPVQVNVEGRELKELTVRIDEVIETSDEPILRGSC